MSEDIDTQIKRLWSALVPFAAVAEIDIGADEHDNDVWKQMQHNRAPLIRVRHLRAALAAINYPHTYHRTEDDTPDTSLVAK